MPTPDLVAHRGYPARYPENTLVGVAAAIDAGARFLEIDVQLSADGVPVVLHDPGLQRTAGRAGTALKMTWDELAAVDVGEADRLDAAFAGTSLPSLAQLVELVAAHADVHLFVEVKRESLRHHGRGTVMAPVLDALRPLGGRCTVISFDFDALRHARDRDGRSIGWILQRYDETARAQVAALAPELLFANRRLLPPPPDPLWHGDWDWAIYTVDDAPAARALAARGVRFVETDAVGELIAAMG
jgi:glycerophosphoryl diester phosphodiesterase